MKILVTGFNPFGKEKINPAIEVVKRLPNQIAGAQIIKLEIPTEFKRSAEVVHRAIEEHRPDVVLDIGQAGGRKGITPECVAINLDDEHTPDNAKDQRLNHRIANDGQPAYFTELPIKRMVAAIRKAGLPSCISTTAGTYVCNHIMYSVQYMRDKEFPHLKAGFIHIPFLPSQLKGKPKGTPSLTLKQDVKGLTVAIKTLAKNLNQPDAKDIGEAYGYRYKKHN